MRVAGLLVVIAAIAAALGYQWPTSRSSTAAPRSERWRAPGEADRSVPWDPTVGDRSRARGEADGAVPDGTTVFDDDIPGVANLDPALLGALRRATTKAAKDGVEVF